MFFITDLPHTPITLLTTESAGLSTLDKLARVREAMTARDRSILLLTKLDDVCWLFNMRGSDVEYNPLVYAYGVVTQNEAFMFIHPNRLSIEQTAEFEKNGVQIREYDAFLPFIDAMAKQKSDATEEICFDASDVSFAVFSRLEGRNPDTTFKYSIEFA